MRIIDWSSDVFSSDLFSVMEKPEVVAAIKDCDFIFLAADGHRARRLFNALVHQYLIPGVQIGTRIQVDTNSGAVINVHTTTKPVTPSKGRSEERRVGKEGVRTLRSRWSPEH